MSFNEEAIEIIANAQQHAAGASLFLNKAFRALSDVW